ncbi:radical SAM protein [Sutterella sp.]|uniref:radical SAM protein n=1 Tax=Sutterella sp. TaxID=1981025 RepID=UPI0026E06D98|nr:radical SAM protein [Sutterella sp.]MDO5532794.1 radical SAM protein [Sutterella sp.]
MSTILFPSPIFGPVHSRRLGISLGINLLPSDGKVCSFDCIYCECGLNMSHRPHLRMPARQEVREKLEEKLTEMAAQDLKPDAITFAGNGEPTGHPEFAGIVDDVLALRDRFCPKANVCVLCNAFYILKPAVFEALKRVDRPLLKLDTVNPDYIRLVDRPQGRYDLDAIIERMKEFNGRCAIQTMFLTGTWQGTNVDNTGDEYVEPWLETLKAINPELVTIYTIDRETPDKSLAKASREKLDQIGERVRALGFECTVSY